MKTADLYEGRALLPALDPEFRPAVLFNREYVKRAGASGKSEPLVIAVERSNGLVSVYRTAIFSDGSGQEGESCFYAERLVKTLLWIWGGWKVTICGPSYIASYIREAYSPGGRRDFDQKFMSRVYEKPFTVVSSQTNEILASREAAVPVGGHLKGCRIGLDLGGSNIKVSAVVDGEAVYSEQVPWEPKLQSNPEYHYNHIVVALKSAASHMPRLDAVGVSSAGIYIDNRAMVASLFIRIPEDLFEQKGKDIFQRVQREFGGIPLQVANDGDVTALSGAMSLQDTEVLGISMGTSEAGGYVDSAGNITGWLNELAFVPVDYNTAAMQDEWSGDVGCGVKYFSQDAVIKLAARAGIELDEKLSPAGKFEIVRRLLDKGDKRARAIFESIGCYFGYGIALYADFYKIRHVLILGGVTSGKGGEIIIEKAGEVLRLEFPELYAQIKLHLPEESGRSVGQSIAAAGLPEF